MPSGPSVRIAGDDTRLEVRIDGHPLPVTAITLVMGGRGVPNLILALPLAGGIVAALDQARPRVADEARRALIAMGWTPPPPGRRPPRGR